MIPHHHALYGNRDGSHQLLQTDLHNHDPILGELRFLVDRPAGHVGAEVLWSPYWGCSPLGSWWVLWRGVEDPHAPRKNMVTSSAVLISQDAVASLNTLTQLILHLGTDTPPPATAPPGAVADALAREDRPVVVPGISSAPSLLLSLWPRLWPAARSQFSLRTLFGPEGLESGPLPDIVVVPTELRPRWRTHAVVETTAGHTDGIGSSWLSGQTSPELDRLLHTNSDRLPGSLSVLTRLHRIAHATAKLRRTTSRLTDALLIVRTAEALPFDLKLPPPDLDLLAAHLSEMCGATLEDIRTASLVTLRLIGDAVQSVEVATSRWIRDNLPSAPDEDALWILKQQAGHHHAAWWRRAVQSGLADALADPTSGWSTALWRWWTVNHEAVTWTQSFFSSGSRVEASLLGFCPVELEPDTRSSLMSLCAAQQWPRLLAHLIRSSYPLHESVRMLREAVAVPESGLDVLLEPFAADEVVQAAAASTWRPLVDRAADLTVNDPALLANVHDHASGGLLLVAAHLKAGGRRWAGMLSIAFVHRVFDACNGADEAGLRIADHIAGDAGVAALEYANAEHLWLALGPRSREALLTATATAWLEAYVARGGTTKPVGVLAEAIHSRARLFFDSGPVGPVINFLKLFDEISESQVTEWLLNGVFQWQPSDTKRLGGLLVQRGWAEATRALKCSWKDELRAVAWHARSLLGYWDRFFGVLPALIDGRDTVDPNRSEGDMSRLKILFLAANPASSHRLRLDEEARAIEDKLSHSKLRDAIEFCSRWAIRPGDLQQALLEEDPVVVHFSGHGGGAAGIVLHSDTGTDERLVSASALAQLFAVLGGNIRLVVLNACYSVEQARAVVEQVDFVVGMADSIGDDGATAFAKAFYQGLAYGKSVQTAFDLGLNELHLIGLKDDKDVPVLLVGKDVDATAVTLL